MPIHFAGDLSQEIDDFLDLARNEFGSYAQKSEVYSRSSLNKPGTGVIQLKSGLILPEETEDVLVLDKEFNRYMADLFSKMIDHMSQGAGSPSFSFAERTLLEFVTIWFYCFFSPDLGEADKKRMTAQLMAGHYKYVVPDDGDYKKYISQRQGVLLAQDHKRLETMTSHKYYDKVFKIWKNEANKRDNRLFLEEYFGAGVDGVMPFMHQRTHANPMALMEAFHGNEKKNRHKYLLAGIVLQAIEYFRGSHYGSDFRVLLDQRDLVALKIKSGTSLK